MSRAPLLGLLLVLGEACSDYSLQPTPDHPLNGEPAVEVEPAVLDFWDIGAGETEVLTFEVRNVGAAVLQIEDFGIDDVDGPFTLVGTSPSFDLQPGESTTTYVSFTPSSPDEQTGTVSMTTNDPAQPSPTVTLVGAGRVGWLAITPQDYEFADAQVPCPDSVTLTLQNVGTDDIVIDGLRYESDGQLSLGTLIDLPLRLNKGATTTLEVELNPTSAYQTEGVLTVSSNDPRGELEATQRAQPAAADQRSEAFQVPTDPPVDVLFAVDQSCSMDDDAKSIAENFSTFIETISASTDAWRIGVVTQDDGCLNGGALDEDTVDLEETFAAAVVLGEDADIDDDEALLKLADKALQQTGLGECNDGFLRDGALTHVVVVSDEPDRSAEQASAWTWEFWLERLLDHAPLALKVSGIVDVDGCNEGDDGYAQIIEATGGERLSICSTDWADAAEALAHASTERLYSFALAEEPDASTLRVEIDGEKVAGGWEYDTDSNAVVFPDGPPVGGDGSTVVITYSVAATCP